MTYVKLIAKPDTWFKEGTEVYDYDTGSRRLTKAEWEIALAWSHVLVRGIRITENPESEGGGQAGKEREDGECCLCDEFTVEYVEESR